MSNALGIPAQARRLRSRAQSDGTFRQAAGFVLSPLLFLYLMPLGLTPAPHRHQARPNWVSPCC